MVMLELPEPFSGQIRCRFACSSCHHARHSPSILRERICCIVSVCMRVRVYVCLLVCLILNIRRGEGKEGASAAIEAELLQDGHLLMFYSSLPHKGLNYVHIINKLTLITAFKSTTSFKLSFGSRFIATARMYICPQPFSHIEWTSFRNVSYTLYIS